MTRNLARTCAGQGMPAISNHQANFTTGRRITPVDVCRTTCRTPPSVPRITSWIRSLVHPFRIPSVTAIARFPTSTDFTSKNHLVVRVIHRRQNEFTMTRHRLQLLLHAQVASSKVFVCCSARTIARTTGMKVNGREFTTASASLIRVAKVPGVLAIIIASSAVLIDHTIIPQPAHVGR